MSLLFGLALKETCHGCTKNQDGGIQDFGCKNGLLSHTNPMSGNATFRTMNKV